MRDCDGGGQCDFRRTQLAAAPEIDTNAGTPSHAFGSSGELALLWAVFIDGVESFRKEVLRGTERSEVFTELLDWMYGRESDSVFSIVFVRRSGSTVAGRGRHCRPGANGITRPPSSPLAIAKPPNSSGRVKPTLVLFAREAPDRAGRERS